MEERSSPHRMTQRHLGDPPEDAPPPEVPEIPQISQSPRKDEVVVPRVDPAGRAHPPEPSETALRLRQRAWQEERARFEASKRRPATPEAAPK
jgi:hypothetical protein